MIVINLIMKLFILKNCSHEVILDLSVASGTISEALIRGKTKQRVLQYVLYSTNTLTAQ
jgi:hypothetical protein